MNASPNPHHQLNYWTKVIQCALPVASNENKPCDYAPWKNVLLALEGNPEFVSNRPTSLMAFAEHFCRTKWPAQRRDQIEFAITFLEADVMLFRSGYCKRHLLKRLRQSKLTNSDALRLNKILRRAVKNGTGLEEYREHCKVAAYLVIHEHLPDLTGWLDEMAQGALLTNQTMPTAIWMGGFKYPEMKPKEHDKLFKRHLFFSPKWGFSYPDFRTVVPAGKLTKSPAQKSARNAFKMLYAIQMRQASQPKR